MDAPILKEAIPMQAVNELAAYGPFDLNNYFETEDGSELRFSAETKSGEALPKGLICTSDGMLTGIPAKGTSDNYELIITAENDGGSVQVEMILTIKPTPVSGDATYLDKLKAQVWEAVENNLPVPDFGDIYGKDISPLEIYYLLERWGVIKIWDAFNLDPPGELQEIKLEGASEHYNVYDRGSCIVACPKDLFSHERTLEDGLRTARAMADEVYRRDWTVELSGFDKLTRAAWVQIQHLSDQHGKRLDVINYNPSTDDINLYNSQAAELGNRQPE